MKIIHLALTVLVTLIASNKAHAIHVVSKDAGIDITTTKVTHITGIIDTLGEFMFDIEQMGTHDIKGDRVIIIDSPGGIVDNGQSMIDTIEKERAEGVKMICVINKNAHSMAFNVLTHCDVRLSVKNGFAIVHKIAVSGLSPMIRWTAKRLQEIVDDLKKSDEPYAKANAKAMNLSDEDYDTFAENETAWTAAKLKEIGYLKGICTVEGDILPKKGK